MTKRSMVDIIISILLVGKKLIIVNFKNVKSSDEESTLFSCAREEVSRAVSISHKGRTKTTSECRVETFIGA